MSDTPKRKYRAIREFTSPDGAAELAKAKRGQRGQARLMDAQIGDVLPEPCPELLRSWLANDCVEEVTKK